MTFFNYKIIYFDNPSTLRMNSIWMNSICYYGFKSIERIQIEKELTERSQLYLGGLFLNAAQNMLHQMTGSLNK
jgi:hypothetical protein